MRGYAVRMRAPFTLAALALALAIAIALALAACGADPPGARRPAPSRPDDVWACAVLCDGVVPPERPGVVCGSQQEAEERACLSCGGSCTPGCAPTGDACTSTRTLYLCTVDTDCPDGQRGDEHHELEHCALEEQRARAEVAGLCGVCYDEHGEERAASCAVACVSLAQWCAD